MNASAPPGARERARLVQRLFEEAVDLDAPARGALLAEACGEDRALREEVEQLLESLGRARTGEILPPLAPLPDRPARKDLVGMWVNNYEVVAPIAQGGMGAVYLARHRFFERQAALKVLHAELSRHGDMVQRFLNEARAANAIHHPNIIDVVDAGILEEGGRPYILMEHLEGESLGARLRAGRLTLDEAVRIGIETADALAAAHDQKIVHRDLKPENLFLVRQCTPSRQTCLGTPQPGGGVSVKVLDFGIAKLRADIAGTAAQTQTGMLLGTPQYMSPEQCRDVSAVDHRTDVYSLGLILFEMVCGRPPFQATGGFGDVLYQQLTVPPPRPRTLNRDLPATLEAVILRCLAKDPGERYASMRELGDALRGLGAAASAPTVESPPPARTRARVVVMASVLFLAAAAAAIALTRPQPSAPATAVAKPAAVESKAVQVPAAHPADAGQPIRAIVKPAEKPSPKPTRPRLERRDIPDFLQQNPYR